MLLCLGGMKVYLERYKLGPWSEDLGASTYTSRPADTTAMTHRGGEPQPGQVLLEGWPFPCFCSPGPNLGGEPRGRVYMSVCV